MRHLIALVALATAFISTTAFPAWKTVYRTDNLTGLTHPEAINVEGRLTHDGSPDENYESKSVIIYNCERQDFSILGTTIHHGIPELNNFPETDTTSETDTLRGIFDGPNRPVNKVERFKFHGITAQEEEEENFWLMFVSAATGDLAASSGLFEKIKTGEVTSIKIEFPTDDGDLVFEYDTDNFPTDACE